MPTCGSLVCEQWCRSQYASQHCFNCGCSGCSYCIRLWELAQDDMWYWDLIDDALSISCSSEHGGDLEDDEQCEEWCEGEQASECASQSARAHHERIVTFAAIAHAEPLAASLTHIDARVACSFRG
jgi:hypothetical protein